MTTITNPQLSGRAATRKTLLGTGIGNAVEWYDWAIYATFASFISGQLFSKADATSAFLATMAIFAVGFVARPFGGMVFGLIGDEANAVGSRKRPLSSMTPTIVLQDGKPFLVTGAPGVECP